MTKITKRRVTKAVERAKQSEFSNVYSFGHDPFGNDSYEAPLPKTIRDALEKMTEKEIRELVNDTIENSPSMVESFLTIQMQMLIVFCLKQKDYGPTNIALGTRLENEKEVNAARRGVLVRTFDKVNRMINLDMVEMVEAINESLLDAWEDISVYAIISQVLQRGDWSR